MAFASVGVPLVSDDLAITIADGSSDFDVGDTFAIAVAGGNYAAYAINSGPQFAAAVLAFDTTTTASTAGQFATARGSAILDAASTHIIKFPGGAWLPSFGRTRARGTRRRKVTGRFT